jgi:Protein of unknown function (DUF3306)
MSDSETFLSRWLRLKRESEASSPPVDAPSPAAFDVAGLPPIESIVADSDIREFLREGVPAELTRAALRSAWTADPAIRDFVGIAENQWNFNDHACIPGFGPLEAADYLAVQALGSLTDVAQETPQDAESREQSALRSNRLPEAARSAAAPPIMGKTTGVVAAAAIRETAGVAEAGGGETGSGAAAPRAHGGALPQ